MIKLKPRIKRIMFDLEEAGNPIRQADIAEKLGVTSQQVSLWVRGRSYPRCETLFELAHLLGVKVDDLYEVTVEEEADE